MASAYVTPPEPPPIGSAESTPLVITLDTTRPTAMPSWVEAAIRDALRQRASALQFVPRVWPIERIALAEARRVRVEVRPSWALDNEARHVVRAAQDQQRTICEDAAAAATIILDPGSSDEANAAAWTDLRLFIHADLKIRPKVAPSAKVAVPRTDLYEIYTPVMRLLQSDGWRRRAAWPLAYLGRAARRAEHQYHVRAAQSLRSDDRRLMAIDEAVDLIPEPDEPCALGIDAEAFLAALRATGRPADIEIATDVEMWISRRTGKASMGEARYRRMLRWIRSPRSRAIARRVGLEQDPSSMSTGVLELPLWTYRPGWARCYRTAEAPALPPPPGSMA
jgi:hypothetical protein